MATRVSTERRLRMHPEPGLYKTRLVRGGLWVPAHVFWETPRDPETGEVMDRPLRLACLVAGEERDPWDVWPLHPVGEDEYRRLLAEMPDDPRAPANLRTARTF